VIYKHEGRLLLKHDSILAGLVKGDVTVSGRSVIKVTGMIVGDLVIGKLAKVCVSGTVIGDVINMGHFELRGMLKGRLFDRGGDFEASSRAVIASRRS
jgi:cytoskeletal protein CcmA (bactofilin family)